MAQTNDQSANARPLILVCNDDGIDSEGIRTLAVTMTRLGEVHVVAPTNEQSAVGHAITVREPVRARPWTFDECPEEITAHAVTGTPADCVKLAVNQLVRRKPDLVVSGINRGPNTAVNVIYSGTVSAATEASILDIDAVAFSLCAWEGGHYEAAGQVAERVARQVLHGGGLPPGVLLNVNIPNRPFEEIAGTAITRQARSRWEESFSERVDPFDRPYYWLSGEFVNLDEGENTDLGAIENGYVSITPIHYDLTAYDVLDDMRARDWSGDGKG